MVNSSLEIGIVDYDILTPVAGQFGFAEKDFDFPLLALGKPETPVKIFDILETAEIFQSAIDWSNDNVPQNIWEILVTLLTSHKYPR